MDPDKLASLLLPLGPQAWALDDSVHGRVLDVLNNPVSYIARVAEAGELVARSPESRKAGKDVAVVPLMGVLTPKASLMSVLFGGGMGGLEGFRKEFSAAVNDPNVGTVIIETDSPGGVVSMIPETAKEIRDAKGSGKRIVAHVNQLAASAAYWLVSQADEIVVTPSGQTGSIGVYRLHEDISQMAEEMGVKLTFVKAGKHKTDGNPYEPLSDQARESWQEQVNSIYGDFVQAVAKGRGTRRDSVEKGYGEGRVLSAKASVEAGLADRIATLDETIGQALAGKTGARAELEFTNLPEGVEVIQNNSGTYSFHWGRLPVSVDTTVEPTVEREHMTPVPGPEPEPEAETPEAKRERAARELDALI